MSKHEFKKDPAGIYSDLPIDPNDDLNGLSEDDLRRLYDKMSKSEVAADVNPATDPERDTMRPDWESRKKAIEDRLKSLQMGRPQGKTK